MLPWPLLERAVRKGAEWGYRVLAVSGGEPLLYPHLTRLLDLGHSVGMTTSVVTNGLLIGRPRTLEALALADTVAVSVDGLSNCHDDLRGRPRAFEKVLIGLAALRQADIPFAISCGVTPQNLAELSDLASAVCDAGARALQLHPVEDSGRASVFKEALVLDDELATAFYVLAHALKVAYADRLAVSIDAIHRITAVDQPHMLYAAATQHEEQAVGKAGEDSRLASHVGVLVLDPFGNLMPVSYGFAQDYWLGNIKGDLNQLVGIALAGPVPHLNELGRQVLARIAAGEGPDVFNPSDVLARSSHVPLGRLFSPLCEKLGILRPAEIEGGRLQGSALGPLEGLGGPKH